MTNQRMLQIAQVSLRLALGVTFLTSIGDRFGVLGPYGTKNLSWGDWDHFKEFVAVLNWFVPKAMIPALAAVDTAIELALGIALLLGIYQRIVAWSSAALLTAFALTMTLALGIVAPISYSVFTAVGGALLLGTVAGPHPVGALGSRIPSAEN